MNNANNLYPFLLSMANEDHSAIVVCNLQHEIIYMNKAAKMRYVKRGGAQLLGGNLLNCHNEQSKLKIEQILHWFDESQEHNRVYTFYNNKENKDVYMIALRDEDGTLIGYYEKHEYRNHETMTLYEMSEH